MSEYYLHSLDNVTDFIGLFGHTIVGDSLHPVQAVRQHSLLKTIQPVHFLQARVLWAKCFEPPISVFGLLDRLFLLCFCKSLVSVKEKSLYSST